MNVFMPWFSYLVTSLALVYLLTESMILAPLRLTIAGVGPVLTSLVYCRACTGFWVGIAMAAFRQTPFDGVFLSGFTVMLLGYVWSLVAVNASWEAEEALREERE
jgi:hypothetical protein